MEQIYLVYKTDSHHSYNSRDIIGVADCIGGALIICQLKAAKEHRKISQEQVHNLVTIKQTQGYKGEGEFQFEEVQINALL